MAVVIASSHSRKMSTSESRPRTPQPPGPPGVGVSDDAEGPSEIAGSYGASHNHTPTPIKAARLTAGFSRKDLAGSSAPTSDSDFVNKHLNLCPEALMKSIRTKINISLVAQLQSAVSEDDTYLPASELLTNISRTIWSEWYSILTSLEVAHHVHA